MAFEHTLRAVQAARALVTIFGCVSVVLFSFVLKLRKEARQAFLDEITREAGDFIQASEPTGTGWGSLALLGLAASIAWNAFCFFDLCINKHYRFDRRVCIFADLIAAFLLLILGFLTFLYDTVLYISLNIAKPAQVRFEVAAIVFLSAACIAHVGFFCYGCKDPNGAPLSFEHVPLDPNTPPMPLSEFDSPSSRSRANTYGKSEEGLVEIDLGKKVQIIKIQQQDMTKEVPEKRHSPRTPDSESNKRLGMVGVPPQISTPRTERQEQSPFLDPEREEEWI